MNSSGTKVETFSKEGSITADFVLKSIDTWVETLTKLTVLVVDNARIHHATIFKERLDYWESKGLYIFYLPAYSPHLNRIETLWRQCKYRWIRPQDYKDMETLKNRLDSIWTQFGTEYSVNFKN